MYHVPRTISSPIVQAILELNLLDHPIRVETLTFADLKSASHLAINPMGTSPAFTSPGPIVMWESGAVMTHILETYDVHHQLHPPPPPLSSSSSSSTKEEDHAQRILRAKYLQLQQYLIATVYPFIASLYIHTFKPQDEQDATYVAQASDKWRTLLGPTLATWLGDGPYFLGSTLSAIDLIVTKPLTNVHAMNMLQDDFPTLYQLYQRVTELPSYARAYQAQGPYLVISTTSDGQDAAATTKTNSERAMQVEPRRMILVPNH